MVQESNNLGLEQGGGSGGGSWSGREGLKVGLRGLTDTTGFHSTQGLA